MCCCFDAVIDHCACNYGKGSRDNTKTESEGIASRRHRITLYRERQSQGAGGRLQTSTPVLADVWAAVEESAGSLTERAGHEWVPLQARFTVRYQAAHLAAKRLSWRGNLYRITGTAASRGGLSPLITFDAKLMEGDAP